MNKTIKYFLDHIDEVVDVQYVPIGKDVDQSLNLIIPSYNGHMINVVTKNDNPDNNSVEYINYNFIIGTDCDYVSATKLIDLFTAKKHKS